MGSPVQERCRICGLVAAHPHVTAREMMFGAGEPFDYFLCDGCGTLQIASFPPDIARHYDPSGYYSFNASEPRRGVKRALRRAVARWMVGRPERYPTGKGPFERLKRRCQPWIALIPGLRLDHAVLDVGSGDGHRLRHLAAFGFTNLSGIDPFMPPDRAGRTADGIQLIAGDLSELEQKFDLITMHHSLEHFEDPARMLGLARDRLAPGGRLFVGIPVLQQWVWQRYGVNWSQLDAPRHYYLFPADTFVAFAERQGFRCVADGYNSQGWALACSEAYQRGISPEELTRDPSRLAAFEAEATELNARGEGEAGWFLFEPA